MEAGEPGPGAKNRPARPRPGRGSALSTGPPYYGRQERKLPCPHRGLGQGRVRATACLHGSAPRPGPGPRPGPARRATCSPVCGAAVRQRAGTLPSLLGSVYRPSAADIGWRSHSVCLGSAPRRFCGLSVSLGRVSASLGREHRRRWQSGHLQRGRWLAVPLIFTPDRDGAPLCRGACACVTCWHDRPSRRPSSNAPSPDDAHRLASLSQKAALSPKLHCRKKSFNYANKY